MPNVATIIIGLALFGGGFWAAWDWRAAKCDAQIAGLVEASQKSKDAEAEKAHGAATELEKESADAEIVYREITVEVDRIVERPVYRDRCFDDDGLRAANRALAGPRAAAAEPDRPVPRPDAAP
ncbi:hypothetical protein [Parvibaculum sp.]|uniref:hypothetical protein n=1 Tax=Parvibaculum sp. TaxID=2024848 RepID=UPI001D95C48D|nr:hypothetical protein [Parvibaculum sp.]MBX3490918.1 hypothetical protein [Parvibaculum sp.]